MHLPYAVMLLCSLFVIMLFMFFMPFMLASASSWCRIVRVVRIVNGCVSCPPLLCLFAYSHLAVAFLLFNIFLHLLLSSVSAAAVLQQSDPLSRPTSDLLRASKAPDSRCPIPTAPLHMPRPFRWRSTRSSKL
jgi:hypothetical protein